MIIKFNKLKEKIKSINPGKYDTVKGHSLDDAYESYCCLCGKKKPGGDIFYTVILSKEHFSSPGIIDVLEAESLISICKPCRDTHLLPDLKKIISKILSDNLEMLYANMEKKKDKKDKKESDTHYTTGAESEVFNNINENDCRRAPKGKYRIVCVDKFYPPGESTDVVEDCEEMEIALKKARFMTKKCMKNSSYDIAQVFYVYDDKGKYLGGDAWVNE